MKKKLSRQDAIYAVALSGISAGLALLFVWLGVVVRYSTIAFFVAASMAIMVPMTRKYYVSSLIAFAVSAGLSFVIVGDIISVIGYILYFGPIALLTAFLANIKLGLFKQLIIKLIFINGILAALYYGFGTLIISPEIGDVKYWVFALIGNAALLGIDCVIHACYLYIVPKISKALRKNSKENIEENNDDDSPFDDTFEE